MLMNRHNSFEVPHKPRKLDLSESLYSGTTLEPSTFIEPDVTELSGTHSFVNSSHEFSMSHRLSHRSDAVSHRSDAGSHTSAVSERRNMNDFGASQRSFMGTQRLDFGESRGSMKLDLGASQRSLGSSQTLNLPPRVRARKMPMPSPMLGDDDGEDLSMSISPPMRPRTHAGVSRPALSFSQSLGSLKMSLSQPLQLTPSTPQLRPENFRQVNGGVSIIFFDFDGTLTATPGDRAARRHKLGELCERAPMLEPRLRALRAAGITLGIISKSTEATIRDALGAASLEKYFDAPVLGKAVGFEGKVGFIEDMAREGILRVLNTRSVSPEQRLQAAAHRVLLVDDDLRELERARERGVQVYAAPPEGGLQEKDFDIILQGIRLPNPPRIARPATTAHQGRWNSALFPARPGGKWRNLIIFSGECFEG